MIKNQTLFAFLFKGAVVAALVGLPAALSAQDAWFPSKYGQQDTLGAANNLSASHVLKASRLITQGKVYSLGVDISSESPPLPSGPREYKLSLVQPAKGAAGTLAHHANGKGITQGANKLTANADFLTIWMGIGTQIEGLGHIGIDNLYYNGEVALDCEFNRTVGPTLHLPCTQFFHCSSNALLGLIGRTRQNLEASVETNQH